MTENTALTAPVLDNVNVLEDAIPLIKYPKLIELPGVATKLAGANPVPDSVF